MEIALTTIDQVLSITTSIIFIQVLKRMDQKSTNFLLYLRIVYGLSQAIHFLLIQIMKRRIKERNDQRKIKVKKEVSFNFYKQEGEDEEVEDDDEVEITYEEFDTKEIKKIYKSFLLQLAVISLGHYKWGLNQPLIIQTISLIRSLFFNPLYLSYLYGYDMKRPFENNMLLDKRVKYQVEKKKKKKEE